MNKTFKKVTLAAAVAGAMGMAAGAAQAITLSTPGNAVLIPYVLYDSASGVDTAIGVTSMGTNTVPDTATSTGALHWYFYNTRSCHEADSMIPMTHNDFVGIMWSDLAKVAVTGGCTQAPLNGMKGYMIITGNETPNSLSIFGDAALIQGAWVAAAYIPTLPLLTANLTTVNGYPHVATSANAFNFISGTDYDMDLRYYVKDLGKRTDLVYWTNKNHKNSSSDADYLAAVNVYNEDEVGSSNSIKLNDELNVITLTNTSSPIGFVTSYQSGFINVMLPADSVYNPAVLSSNSEIAVAFSLIFTPNGGAQTVLAHQRSAD